jgi:intein-encoded DNA endonuclease-like protein
MSNEISFTPEQLRNILALYSNDKYSILKISKLFGVNPSVIKRILRKYNVEIRSNNIYKSKACDETFFDVINTEEKAYWLGFIYADGYITQRRGQDVLSIKLSINDRNHLEKFKKALKSKHSIGTYTSTNGYNIGKQYCSIAIYNQHIVNALIDKGISYNKTKILKFPTREQVPKEFISHFIRGFFDGDGSIYHVSQNDTGCISFTGTENMLNAVLSEIKQYVNTNVHVYKYKNKDVYDLKIGGRNQLNQLYKYFYENASIFLDRKEHKFKEILMK